MEREFLDERREKLNTEMRKEIEKEEMIETPALAPAAKEAPVEKEVKEEGEETKKYHQNIDSSESKPTKPSKKSKESINKINSFSSQDNVIAFDEHDDSEDVPIGLTYRQPSFSSMGDHLISKGGDSLADIVPLKTIPIEEAIIEEEIEKEKE